VIREELKFEDRRGLQLSEPYGQSGLAKGSFTNPVPSLTNLNTGDDGSRLSCKKHFKLTENSELQERKAC
jgi:hypothetical protein